ncbi:hypothetical protein BJX66DRAFT_58108 [Aspergillus keveii]|uniref:Zn(2)-C6 fungal-type domain-containing protein n=1 Tax=Aspergillus keveii TaxID=714993 RepID=A0ABR4FQM9_9EURO
MDDESSVKRRRVTGPNNHQTVPKACIPCAESKVRCVGGNPCQRCSTKQIQCVARSGITSQQAHCNSVIPDIGLGDPPPMNVGPRGGFLDERRGSQNSRSLPNDQDITPSLVSSLSTIDNPTVSDGQSQTHLQGTVPGDYLATGLADLDQTLANQAEINHGDEPGNSQFTDFLMGLIFTSTEQDQSSQCLDTLLSFPPGDVLDFTGESFGLQEPKSPVISEAHLHQNDDSMLSGQSLDQGLIGYVKPPTPHQPPPTQNGISLGTQAFQESLWTYKPSQQDQWKPMVAKLSQYTQSIDDVFSECSKTSYGPPIVTITSTTRNKIMSLIISLSDQFAVGSTASLLSLFPSEQLLMRVISQFLVNHKTELDTFIHVPTFNLLEQTPELLVGMVASAALSSPLPPVHEFGSFLHEAHRELNARLNCNDQRNIRILGPLQSLAVEFHSGIWSGDRRKMEMSEGLRNSLVTMLRRAHVFSGYDDPRILPEPGDSPQMTENKWLSWVRHESFKRLAIHVLITDVQCSMSLQIPPLISPSELLLPLPASKDIWEAKSSSEWRRIFLAKDTNKLTPLPSLHNCIEKLDLVLPLRDVVDTQLTSLAVLSGHWPPIFYYRQRAQLRDGRDRQNSLVQTALYSDAKEALEAFSVVFTEWCGDLAPSVLILHERLLMSLYVSLEDVQLFGGKAGEAHARRKIPILTAWVKRRESRQAIWHAGQLFRAAKRFPNTLPATAMVALYHASLVLWAYAAVGSIEGPIIPTPDTCFQEDFSTLVRLDGENDAHYFVTLGRGTPVVTQDSRFAKQAPEYVPIRDGRAVMSTVVDFIRTRNGAADSGECLPLVDNLGRLMLELGYAAGRMTRERYAHQVNNTRNDHSSGANFYS